jgi:hypothetical protein
MFSFFDKLFHPFECPNPNCRHKFYGLSRWLIHANEVLCPKCGTHAKPSSDQRAGETQESLGESVDNTKLQTHAPGRGQRSIKQNAPST